MFGGVVVPGSVLRERSVGQSFKHLAAFVREMKDLRLFKLRIRLLVADQSF